MKKLLLCLLVSLIPASLKAGSFYTINNPWTGKPDYVSSNTVNVGGGSSGGSSLYPSTSTILPSSIRLGPVTVVHSSGTYDVYNTTNTTAGALGATLIRSQYSWTDNISILLGPGTYEMGTNYLTLYTSTRTALIGAGRNLTRLNFSGAGWGIQPSSYCYIANLSWGGSGAGLGGLSDVAGTSLILDNVEFSGDQDAVALNGQFDNITVSNSSLGTTFDVFAWSNTGSTTTVNSYNNRLISRNGISNAHGFECFGAGVVNSYNDYIEIGDSPSSRFGFHNSPGLGSCTFNIHGSRIETFNGGVDISAGSGRVNVSNDTVYFSSKTSGTINYLNQTSTQAVRAIRFSDGTTQTTAGVSDTSQVYRTTTTPTYPYGMSVSSDSPNVTFNVNTAGISGFVGTGKSFTVSTDEGSYVSVSEINAGLYANANASVTGETSADLTTNGGVITLNSNNGGATNGTIRALGALTVENPATFLSTVSFRGPFTSTGTNVFTGSTTVSDLWRSNYNTGNIFMGVPSSGFGAIAFGTSQTLANSSLYGNGTNTYLNAPSGGSVSIRVNNVEVAGHNATTNWVNAADGSGFTITTPGFAVFNFTGPSGGVFRNNGGAFYIDQQTSNPIYFRTDTGKTRMTIQQLTGNIGINTTSPLAQLHISTTAEQFRSEYDTSNYWNAKTGSTGQTTFDGVGSNQSFVFRDAVTTQGSFLSTGTFRFTSTGTFEGTVSMSSVTANELYGSSITASTFISRVSTISASNIDWATAGTFTKNLVASTTFTFTNNSSGKSINVRVENTTGNYPVAWPTTIKWPGGTAPTQTTGNKVDIYTFIQVDQTVYGSYVQNFAR